MKNRDFFVINKFAIIFFKKIKKNKIRQMNDI